jgi:hypothetical protein
LKTKNPLNKGTLRYGAWQSGYNSLKGEKNPYNNETGLFNNWNNGLESRIKDDEFNKKHGLNEFSKNVVVDYYSNQPINDFTMGDVSFFINNDLNRSSNKKIDEFLRDKKEGYFIYCNHVGRELILMENRKIYENDLIRVDFDGNQIIIIRNFFNNKNL